MAGETGPGSTATSARGTVTASGPARVAPYRLVPTRACLRSAGADVSAIWSRDVRLRALGDLAQRTSLQVELDDKTLGLAFGDARLLESLLRVPNDPYRLETRRNAILMYRPATLEQARVVLGCLRS
jgi:hypothetical protein